VLTPGGTVLASIVNASWDAKNALGSIVMSGTYSTWVYSDPGNTFCSGCQDLVDIVSNSAGSTDSIGRVTHAQFDAFLTDIGYTPGAGIAPAINVDRDSTGGVVGFDFIAPNVLPGKSTDVLVVETNAQWYMPGVVAIIDSGPADVLSFAPAAIPEPSSLLLMGTALGVAVLLARRYLA